METRVCDLSEAPVAQLLELHDREMAQFSPPGTNHSLDLEALMAPDIEVLGAWDGAHLRAVGALKLHADFAEIKSMRAHPEARGTGAGKIMLQGLIDRACEHGFATIKLETGSGPFFEPALGLYRAFGFEPCEAFAQYTPGEHNQLFSLDVS